MRKIALPDGCRGIDNPRTGEIHRPNRLGGLVHMEDSSFARAAVRQFGEVGSSIFADSQIPTWQCPGCFRTNWEKDDTCRRCGRPKP